MIRWIATVGSAALVHIPAEAETMQLTTTPYIWAPTLNGTTSLGPVEVPVHITPKDFAQGIEVGGMGYIRLDGRRRFVYIEGIVVNYDNVSFRPFFGQSLTSKVRFGEIGTGLNRTIRLNDNAAIKVSPYIGIHHFSNRSFTAGNILTAETKGRWTNPVAGVTFEIPINGRFSLAGKVDAAGFGLTRTHYISGAAMIDVRLNKSIRLDLGYRIAKGDFDSTTGLALDVHGGGPMLALRYAVPVGR